MGVLQPTWLVFAALVIACGDNRPGTGPDAGPSGPGCSDGIDNDSDGDVDFPDDLGCELPTDESEDSLNQPRCTDNRDNDGDGKLDYPDDPGCSVASDDNETDDCPSGPSCPQCANGKDDDVSGASDYPVDPGCDAAGDALELADDPAACGAGLAIKQLSASGVELGMLSVTSASTLPTVCGGGAGAPGIAYVFVATAPSVIVASTDDPYTTADTNLSIRRAACSDPGAVVGCNDNVAPANRHSRLSVSVPAGTYYVIVEGFDVTGVGRYKLTVEQFPGEGVPCTMPSDCGPGLVCRIPLGQTQPICARPVCSDGADDDADGDIDYPLDPGCTAADDATEEDDCPAGPTCPACSDDADNDGDGTTDYPMDPGCAAASGSNESCPLEQEPVSTIASGLVTGTLVGAHDDHDPSCGGTGGPEITYSLTLPKMATLRLSTEGSAILDTVLSLMTSACSEPSLACDDDSGAMPDRSSVIVRANVPAGTYVVAVDAFSSVTTLDAFQLAISGEIGPTGSCEGPLFATGAFVCAPALACGGAPGTRTCRSECSDGLDNNGDGTIDYPNDPGCTAPDDITEATVCPGASCPACADGIDNDGDGAIDFPLDVTCSAAASRSESCAQPDPILEVVGPATAATTVGHTNDYTPSCSSAGAGSGPDVALQLDLPKLDSLGLDLVTGYDSVHALVEATCAAVDELVCRDPTTMSVTHLAAGRYYLIVDGFAAASAGTFTLGTTGVISPAGSCEGPLFASGALTCAVGTTCAGPPGARTCRTECSDGLDNNGNGAIDYPDDPGCASAIDGAENTIACPGPACPVCSNAADDDTDTFVDYPADHGCLAAGGATEVFCATDLDAGGMITMPSTAGTLVGKSNDFAIQSCQSNTGNEVTYTLVLPVPVRRLELDTLGSAALDTVLAVKDANCIVEYGCDDDSAPGADFRSVLRLANVQPGAYAVTVEGYSTVNNAPFMLQVKGTVAPGTACTSPLFASGVLVCPAGCTAGLCQ